LKTKIGGQLAIKEDFSPKYENSEPQKEESKQKKGGSTNGNNIVETFI